MSDFFAEIAKESGVVPEGEHVVEIVAKSVRTRDAQTKDGPATYLTFKLKMIGGAHDGAVGEIQFTRKSPYAGLAAASMAPLAQWAQAVAADTNVSGDVGLLISNIRRASVAFKVFATITHDQRLGRSYPKITSIRVEGAGDESPF
jgi:hypothetical protein